MTTVSGVWLFNETLTRPTSKITQTVNFASNGCNCTRMTVNSDTSYVLLVYMITYNTTAYGTSWADEGYRTVDFGENEQAVDDAYYTWLVANATPDYNSGGNGENATSKYLVRSNSTLYTITDGTLTAMTETEITASLFQTYGVDEIPDGSLLVGLTDPEVLYWQDSTDELPNLTLTVKGTPPLPQMFTSNPMDLTHESIAGISYAEVDASEDVRFAISFDGGTTWKAFDGAAWFDTSDTVPGMLPSTMNAITAEQWAEVVVLDSYMVRFWLPNVTAYVKSVVMHYINP